MLRMWSSRDNFDTKIGNCMRNIAVVNKANKRNSTNIDTENCMDFCISFLGGFNLQWDKGDK